MRFLYYSTQTLLSHHIGIRYYGNKFYVYCSLEFDPNNPGSSNPAALEETFRAIVEEQDRGNPKVIVQKDALKKIAERKLREGQISKEHYDALQWEIKNTELAQFRPLIYLILKDAVKGKIRSVPIEERANPYSEEYIIEGLDEADFEIATPRIRLRSRL